MNCGLMVKVSVCLGSSRPGGVDVSLRGLADQTYEDFEVVFVDSRYHERHKQVLDFVRKVGLKQPFYHVPNHRYNGLWSTPCAGFNTGFMLAEGEIVIMLLDYAYAPGDWIQWHMMFHEQKRLVIGPYTYLKMPEFVSKNGSPMKFVAGEPENTVANILKAKENYDEISIFKSPFQRSWISSLALYDSARMDQDPKLNKPTGPIGYEYMHTKNESFPLQDVLDINGVDETFDMGGGLGDTEFSYRLFKAGCVPWLVHEANVYCLYAKEILPNTNYAFPKSKPDGVQFARWVYDQGEAYWYSRRQAVDNGETRSKSPYDMRERRKEIWDWRSLSQETEAVIPRNDVPDEKWYK